MTVSEAGVAPPEANERSDKVNQVVAPFVARGRPADIFDALAHHPDLMRRRLVRTVGQYNLVSVAVNTVGIQRDGGVRGWDV